MLPTLFTIVKLFWIKRAWFIGNSSISTKLSVRVQIFGVSYLYSFLKKFKILNAFLSNCKISECSEPSTNRNCNIFKGYWKFMHNMKLPSYVTNMYCMRSVLFFTVQFASMYSVVYSIFSSVQLSIRIKSKVHIHLFTHAKAIRFTSYYTNSDICTYVCKRRRRDLLREI